MDLDIGVIGTDDTEQADLRGGHSPWLLPPRRAVRLDLSDSLKCDALVVGAGITGSLMAERLTRQGLNVVIIDRELPGRGSTAASTAMLLWEIDRSLKELTDLYGFERASRVFLASMDTVSGLRSLILELGLRCGFCARDSLYLAAGSNAKDLVEEHRLRQRAGLPGEFLDHTTLMDVFGIARAGAIVSPGSADADPIQLTQELLKVAVSRGARLFEAEAIEFDVSSRSVNARMADGHEIEARWLVLATGYAMPRVVHSTVQKISSTWAIATAPQPEKIWKNGALIWEDSKDYHYARTTTAGRIIIGGEDSSHAIQPEQRDRLIPEKARALTRKLAALWPVANLDIDFRWSGTFDTTDDGMPLIGPVPGMKGIYAAYGYGGNGITFSFLAARLIGDLIAGSTSALLKDFAIDRDGDRAAGQ
ncbi:MAG TPA: FAD-dependent oxidoreductase [Bradyrhizobium sp.]|jgi:glycine/D-amino acid oxidase-like deaminating enzyme|nr:FAD-dependent oxidoreductase [Bradyrhizobium sp.]